LRSRLAACTTVANKHVEEGLDFIGDGLSASHAINTGTYIYIYVPYTCILYKWFISLCQ